MSDGWIKLHRTLQDHWIYPKRNFSDYEAWIDILLSVNHQEKKVKLGLQVLTCGRGESLRSIKGWANRWGWSKAKAYRFLGLLEKEKMIVLKSETISTRLTVCNYDSYQDKRNADETQMKRKRNADETQAYPNKNVKNGKNEKNINIPFSEFWDLYDKKKGSKTNAEKMWNNLSDSERQEIMRLLPGYVSSFSEKKYQPHPTTFLNQRRWESEDEMRPNQEMRIYA